MLGFKMGPLLKGGAALFALGHLQTPEAEAPDHHDYFSHEKQEIEPADHVHEEDDIEGGAEEAAMEAEIHNDELMEGAFCRTIGAGGVVVSLTRLWPAAARFAGDSAAVVISTALGVSAVEESTRGSRPEKQRQASYAAHAF
eukprot:GEMP01061209.1.p1 GENE.GEMP01061209.1~~GEMP01061209.1.p1  ORF type:complete len:142 (+),score=33.45 GEMP01061209.1:101-526(+)